jgi:hypothetical protein
VGAKSVWRRWRSLIIAVAVILTLIGLLAGALFAQAQYRDAAAQLIMQRDRQVALLTAVRLSDELQKLAGELEPIARSQSLYLGLTDRQRLFLRGQSERLSVFDGGVILMDSNGRVRATVPERWDIMSSDWSNQEFFRKMLVAQPPSQYFSSVLDVGPENSPVVVVSVPVLGQNGEMVGVLAGLFRLGESRVSAFYASIVRLRLPGTGNTYIVDNSGRIVYDSGYQRTGQMMDVASAKEAATAEPSKPRLDAEGHEVIASYAPVPGTNWTLVTETDWDQAVAPVQRLATGIIVLLALGMVVPTVGVALLARGQWYNAGEADQAVLEARVSQAMRKRLLPHYPPLLGGWEVAVHHQAAANGATARDLYDFMLLPEGGLMLSLATVADRGLSAVHLMTTTRAAFRTAASRAQSAGQALSLCNNLLCPDVGPSAAITSLFVLLDPASGRLQVANAGFCAPYRWSAGELIEMREGVDFLGQSLDVEFDHDDVLLAPGESIIFYSPGMLGVRPDTGDPFGPDRVRRVLNTSGAVGAQTIVDALRADLGEFADANSLRRLDVTLLALSRSASAQVREKPMRSLRDELRALGETETDL